MHANKPPERSRFRRLGEWVSTVVLSVNIGNIQTPILNQLLDIVVKHINVLAPGNQLPVCGPN